MSGLKPGPISEAKAEARISAAGKSEKQIPFGNDNQRRGRRRFGGGSVAVRWRFGGGSVAVRLGKKSVRVDWVK